jgi:hypothetical protein
MYLAYWKKFLGESVGLLEAYISALIMVKLQAEAAKCQS